MPIPSFPPFSPGALVVPRELNRWLDINPQGGALTRARKYITVPGFSVSVNWLGWSDIVASYNYEAPNNFVLTSLVGELATNPNYLMAIMWKDNSGNVHRYALWNGVGEKLYFTIPLYTGQLIMKNFRFEVWSTIALQLCKSRRCNSILQFLMYMTIGMRQILPYRLMMLFVLRLLPVH
jgi:hypothetical protein